MYRWLDGQTQSLPGQDVNGTWIPNMVSAYVGFWADPESSLPQARQAFDTHIMVGVGNPPVGGVSVQLGLSLPSKLRLDFSVAGIRCYYYDLNNHGSDVTHDPSAACPTPPIRQLPNGYLNLAYRIVPAYHLFEIRCPVISDAPFLGERLSGYVGSEFGELTLGCAIAVFEPKPPPQPSGRLLVTTNPPGLKHLNTPIEVTVVTRDSGNGVVVPGVASIRNFNAAGDPEDFDVPTNAPFTRTFRYTTKRPPDSPQADQYMPGGTVTCPGYDQDRNHVIPFRFIPPGF